MTRRYGNGRKIVGVGSTWRYGKVPTLPCGTCITLKVPTLPRGTRMTLKETFGGYLLTVIWRTDMANSQRTLLRGVVGLSHCFNDSVNGIHRDTLERKKMNPKELARAFDITERTARNWLKASDKECTRKMIVRAKQITAQLARTALQLENSLSICARYWTLRDLVQGNTRTDAQRAKAALAGDVTAFFELPRDVQISRAKIVELANTSMGDTP